MDKLENIDFPAAHSMDTEWFAVDADGNIALFDSGEGGAVPRSNERLRKNAQDVGVEYWGMSNLGSIFGYWAKQSREVLVPINIPSEAVLTGLGISPAMLDLPIFTLNDIHRIVLPSSRSTPWVSDREISNRESRGSWGYPDSHWLLIPSQNEAELIKILRNHASRQNNYIVRFSGNLRLLFIENCPLNTIQTLILKGYLKYAFSIKAYRRGLATLLGLFSYDHYHASLFPYECDGMPIYPLNVNDLPEKLQDVLTWNWLDRVKFPESRKVQPIEHLPCDTWGGTKWWMDTQGNEREGHPEYPLKLP